MTSIRGFVTRREVVRVLNASLGERTFSKDVQNKPPAMAITGVKVYAVTAVRSVSPC